MEVLLALEEKVKSLIVTIKNIKEQHDIVQSKYDSLKSEHKELQAEHAKLAEDNAQLLSEKNSIENTMLKENGHVQELTQERSLTRLVLDELIKSIDLIVENENQLQ